MAKVIKVDFRKLVGTASTNLNAEEHKVVWFFPPIKKKPLSQEEEILERVLRMSKDDPFYDVF